MNKKIKKLVKNPKLFIKDAIINKKIKNQTNEDVSKFFKEKINEHMGIFNWLYHQFPCFIVCNENKKWILGVERKYISKFFSCIYYLSENDYNIKYNLKKHLINLWTYEQLVSDYSKEKVMNFKLTDAVLENDLYFSVECWANKDGCLIAPRGNDYSRKLQPEVCHKLFKNNDIPFLKDILTYPIEDKVGFDIDYVFSWVNSEDPDWQKMYRQYKPIKKNDGNSLSRYTNREELKFALRSLAEYAPWIRNIYIVSNCKPPQWLQLENVNIFWVDHTLIIDKNFLPTFSSHAIEANIHKIPGLSEHFIYSNDDFFLARLTVKEDFFIANGLSKIRFERWGNVNGNIKKTNPDYLNAAINSNRLLENEFHYSTTSLHTHSPQSLNKSIMKEMEIKFHEDFARTSSNKFRNANDIAVTGYLVHHYTYLLGKGVKDWQETFLIQQNHDFESKFEFLLEERNKIDSKNPLSFCLNDGADSHLNSRWNECVSKFLDTFFPEKSKYEK